MRVEVKAPIEEFREVRFFRRGHHQENIEVPRWHGWGAGRSTHSSMTTSSCSSRSSRNGRTQKRGAAVRRRIRPGAVLIKYFRNIASADLNALFPNVGW